MSKKQPTMRHSDDEQARWPHIRSTPAWMKRGVGYTTRLKEGETITMWKRRVGLTLG